MKQPQQRFWPDAQPLVERLGRDFFKSLPERPGVYLMRDAGEAVLYVGKAKNLRKRLGSYRVANPERMPRRHLRLLRLVIRIELQECEDEQAALVREAELLRTLKPRFNRAGTWPGKPRFLAWRTVENFIQLNVIESPKTGWNAYGPLGSVAPHSCALLARLLWLALHPGSSVTQLPQGWAEGRISVPLKIRINRDERALLAQLESQLASLITGQTDSFCQWIEEQRGMPELPFERAWLETEFESLREWFKSSPKRMALADS